MTTTDLLTAPARRRTTRVVLAAGVLCAALTACSGAAPGTVGATGATGATRTTGAAGATSATQKVPPAASAASVATTNALASPPTPSSAAVGTASNTPPTVPTVSTAHPATCALVTEQEVAKALGGDPGPGAADAGGGNSSCVFGPKPAAVTVLLAPTLGPGGFNKMRQATAAMNPTTVAGIGDSAFSVSVGPSVAVTFVKGNTVVSVSILGTLGPLPPGASQGALTLARLAAGRL